jgi:hypothetical protein
MFQSLFALSEMFMILSEFLVRHGAKRRQTPMFSEALAESMAENSPEDGR